MSEPPDLPAELLMFGGTFDPVHNAHLRIAHAAADLLAVRRVLFIPAANPPHKNQHPLASYEDRVNMLRIACSVDSRFEVSLLEEKTERSYSIDTIGKLRGKGTLAFLIGADAFAEIRTWHRWREVVSSVWFAVVPRPGFEYRAPPEARVIEVPGVSLTESSSTVRAALEQGSGNVPVPPGVGQYIRERGLYQSRQL